MLSRLTARWLAVSLVFIALAACGGEDDPKPSPPSTQPTPPATQAPPAVASPTPSAQTTDLARSFREFLPQVDAALQRRDREFFGMRALPRRVTCELIDVQRRVVGGCERIGQQFDGIDVAQWRSDQGGPVSVGTGVNLVARMWNEMQLGSDEFGPSPPRVYALAITPNAPEGSPQAAAVLTAMIRPPANANPPTTAPRRAVLVTHWRREQGQWRLMIILDATTALGEDFLRPTLEGRSTIGAWERYQP